MSMRTVPLSSGLDWAVRLPAGYPLFFMAALLLSIGAAALITAGSVVMLPHESQALGLELAMLHGFHPRQPLVSFIVHNRVSFGGLLIMNGLLYWWLTRQITGSGRRWAWWTLCLSGAAGVSSYLAYYPHGYWDPIHALGTTVIAAALATGLAQTWSLTDGAGLAFRPREPVQRRSILARLLLTVWGGGTLLGGLVILGVGMIPVFVPTDLEFLGSTTAEVTAIHEAVLPFVAHDRIGFGGALVSSGIAILPIVWLTDERNRLASLRLLLLVWAVGAVTAIGVHPLVGYNRLPHLLPFIMKDGAFILAVFAFRKGW